MSKKLKIIGLIGVVILIIMSLVIVFVVKNRDGEDKKDSNEIVKTEKLESYKIDMCQDVDRYELQEKLIGLTLDDAIEEFTSCDDESNEKNIFETSYEVREHDKYDEYYFTSFGDLIVDKNKNIFGVSMNTAEDYRISNLFNDLTNKYGNYDYKKCYETEVKSKTEAGCGYTWLEPGYTIIKGGFISSIFKFEPNSLTLDEYKELESTVKAV